MTVLTLPASRLPDAQALISRWAKRSAKLGLAAPSLSVVRSFTRYWLVTASGDPVGESSEVAPQIPADRPRWGVRSLDMVEIAVAGERPKIAGWWFVAAIEHRDGGNILRSVPGSTVDLPHRFRTSDSTCDHCRLQRDRNETFVVEETHDGVTHKAARYMQVGRSCLRDFVGGVDPAAFLAAYQFARAIDELAGWDADGDGGFFGASRCVTVPTFLRVVAAEVRLRGYVSASKAREAMRPLTPTGIAAYSGLTSRNDDDRASWTDIVTEADMRTADAALAWLASDEAGDSDYIHNCRVYVGPCPSNEAVSVRSANLLASIVPSYLRAAGIKAERAVKADEHLPGVSLGDKLTGCVLTLVGEHAFDSGYGLKWIIRFEDAQGRAVVWHTGDSTGLDIGTQVVVSGTVKKLDAYKGRKQTTLTRCKVAAHVVSDAADGGCTVGAPKRKAAQAVKRDKKGAVEALEISSEPAPITGCTFVGDGYDDNVFAAFEAA